MMRTILSLVAALMFGCSQEPSPPPPTDEAPPTSEVQPVVVPPVTVANSFRHMLRSEAIGQDFLIDVSLPYVMSDAPMPVVYVTDGNSMFPIIANTARLLQLGGELPPMIVVGIGYAVDSTAEILALRTRDLTPTLDAAFVERSSEGPMPLPKSIQPGGAAVFLDFIEREVKPLIEANYRVKTTDATLVGDSLGGLFTLYALFNRTEEYQRYLVGSPSLWWDERTLFNDEAAYAGNAEDLDVDLFLSVGALEEDPANAEDWAKMVSNTQAMARLLEDRSYPNLRMTTIVFDNETHLSVIPATFSRGLREVFADDV